MRSLLVSSVASLVALSGCAMTEMPDAGRVDARADTAVDARGDVISQPDVSSRPDVVSMPDVASMPDASPDVQSMPDAMPSCTDADNDGYGVGAGCRGADCNDMNPAVNAGAIELCDGLDNNCNMMVDEMLGQSSCGMGRCARTVDNCVMGRPQRCEPGATMPETCNGMDDDCDGVVDNGVGATACYTGPMGTQGVGICRPGSQGCPGGMVGACMGQVLPGVETCNGLDDDCDGMLDEGLSSMCYSGPAGTQGIGRCQSGTRSCSAGMMTGCAGEVVPGAESCNGADDDCNGTVDDGIAPIACYTGPVGTQGVGRCRGGNRVCSGGMMTSCTGEIVPSPEICGNGVDEDCNGMVDDGCGVCMPGMTRSCYTGPGGTSGVGICRAGTETCDMTRNWSGVCAGQVVPAAETCGNMLDDNCNGMVDEGCACMPAVTNEQCSTATSYSLASSLAGNTTCGANNHTSSCGGGGGSADAAYSVAIDGTLRTYSFTMTAAAGFDTVLHMHSDVACAAGDEVACNDDAGGMTNVSTIAVPSLPQGTYYLVTDGYSTGNRGAFTLTSTVGAEANNDTCAASFAITRNGTYRGVTTGKAANYTGPCGFQTNLGNDVVFTIAVPAGRSVTVTSAGSSFDTVLYAQTACTTFDAAPTCNDDAIGLQSSITLPTPAAATTYYVVLDGYNGASGTWVLNVSGL